MIAKQDLDKIKNITEEFFKKMTFDGQAEVSQDHEGVVPINLKIDEPSVLIGERGQTLADLQHLLKMVVRKAMGDQINIDLDIQDYKKKKAEYLREMARTFADEVMFDKKEKVLDPMSAYERRIVHMELANKEGVMTESIGEGEERRVVIRPKINE